MEVDPARCHSFASKDELRAWFESGPTLPFVWVEIARKGSGRSSVTWAEVVEVCLAFGWIDGIKKSGDASSYFQRITPRRRGSAWSMRNREIAERLMAEGGMTKAGLATVEVARASGAWDRAYEGQAAMEIPQDFLVALAEAGPDAVAFFDGLNRQNRFPIAHRLKTAKTAHTRSARLHKLVAMMKAGEKFFA